MRTSSIVALVALGAVAPAFAAPIASDGPAYARRATTSSFTAPPTANATTDVASLDPSAALSLGTFASIASFAAPVIGGIINHFKNNGNQQQRRDALELEALLARDGTDESGALKLGTIASIGSFVAPLIGGIINHFTNNGNQQQRRAALEIEALIARDGTDESGALKLGTIASIGSFVAPLVGGIINHFTNNGNQQQRRAALEIEALIARDGTDESGALKLGTIASIGSFVAPLIGGIINHFTNNGNQQQRRAALELEALLAREPSRLGDAATIAQFVSTAVGAVQDFVDAHKHRRDDATDASGALKLGDVANIASIGSSVISAVENIFNNRDFEDLLARDDATDASGALKLGDVANIASIGSSVVSAVENIFNNRDVNVEDLLARDLNLDDLFARDVTTDESGALKLGDFANIASIGGSIISAVHNIFGGSSQQQQREFLEILARADVADESGALKLGDFANIASIGGSIISAVHNIFGGSQQQQREFLEILARADVTDESGALKLGDFANIASIGGSIISAVHNIFGGSSQQQQREFIEELMARSMGSLNDLD